MLPRLLPLLILAVLADAPDGTPTAAPVGSGCLAVAGDSITAGDLAPRFPEYTATAADTVIAKSPAPGVQRRLPVGSGSICVTRRLERLPVEEFRKAIANSLQAEEKRLSREIRFEIVQSDRTELPAGRLEFAVASLPKANESGGPVAWRGRLHYGEGHSLPVYVRLRLWTSSRVCVARRDLAARVDLEGSDCQLETRDFYPFGPAPVETPESLEGHVVRTRLGAGQVVFTSDVQKRLDVESGKTVQLSVIRGAARLLLEAKAVTSGRTGQAVVVLYPVTGKRMEALVTGPGEAEVKVK